MLIAIFITIASLFLGPANCDKMSLVRDNYGNIQTEQELNNFIRILDEVNCTNTGPYAASATMQKAQFAMAPWTKYNYFREGKKMLEEFIQKNPDNIEGRYVRFVIQSHAPFFLGYNQELKADAAFIRQNIDNYELSLKYKNKILNHLDILEKE